MKNILIILFCCLLGGAVLAQKTPGDGRGIETGGKKPTKIKKELAKQNKKHGKRYDKQMKKRAKNIGA